jgi:hypothetical protein
VPVSNSTLLPLLAVNGVPDPLVVSVMLMVSPGDTNVDGEMVIAANAACGATSKAAVSAPTAIPARTTLVRTVD